MARNLISRQSLVASRTGSIFDPGWLDWPFSTTAALLYPPTGHCYLPACYRLSINSESLTKIHREWNEDNYRMGEKAFCNGSRVVFEEGLGNIKMMNLYLVGGHSIMEILDNSLILLMICYLMGSVMSTLGSALSVLPRVIYGYVK